MGERDKERERGGGERDEYDSKSCRNGSNCKEALNKNNCNAKASKYVLSNS